MQSLNRLILNPNVDSITALFKAIELSYFSVEKCVIDAIVCTTLWYLWCFRNDQVFDRKKIRRNQIVDAIKEFFLIGFVIRMLIVLKIGVVGSNNL